MIHNPVIVTKSEDAGVISGMVNLPADSRTITIPVDKLYSHFVLFPINIPNPNTLLASPQIVPICITTPDEAFRYNSTYVFCGSAVYPGWYDAEQDIEHADGINFAGLMWSNLSQKTIVAFSETEIVAGYVATNNARRSLPAGKYGYVAW